MKPHNDQGGPIPTFDAKGGFVERMFRYWIKHHIAMSHYRIGHY